jgi:hypothetical protein
MNGRTNLDQVRAWVEGRLAPDEAARFELRLARDAEL